ncbi:hypothetical protein MBRA1_002796 [Malassezia brasiliensis]|uniref:BZIP domain-containing protein n=1 Tax=Malassezia brasiliensis TaxID=1821822 RepID=A0AAF0DTS5_9BASI|nr:hypothetical protein MBRA1_002796 [Malassezia brasiliensis]
MMDMRSSVPVAPSPVQAALPASSPPADDIVQPSKEWVLPARGKPGRKPAAEVPLTKRKAQNRASQRAFRERRHAYLTELEEKVARYEAREIDANVQMQRIALQCREEATILRQKNEALMARCEQLEQQLKALAASTPRTDARSPSGCLPPKHEVGASPARDAAHMGASPGAYAGRRPSAPGTHASAPTPTHTLSQLTKTLRDTGSPGNPDEIGFDCGFCPDPSLCVCRGKAQFEFGDERMAPWTPGTHPTATTGATASTTPGYGPPTPSNAGASPAVPLARHHGPKSRLWPTTAAASALSPGESPRAGGPSPLGTSRIGSWAAASASAALGVRPRSTPLARSPKRLWAVEPASATPTTAPSPRTRAPNAPTPCSGDPRTCGACQEDPTLAEFCSAVTRSVHVPTSTQRKTPGPAAAYSPTAAAPSPGAPRESIPQAFTRLRNHPNFGQWKGNGGLQMLADVISRDAKDKDAPEASESTSAPDAPGARAASGASTTSEAAPAPEKAQSAPAAAEPNAEALSDAPLTRRTVPDAARTARPSSDARTTSSASPLSPPPPQSASPHPALPVRRAASDQSPDTDAEAARQKRAKTAGVYVRSDAVTEALALLDRPDAKEAPDASAASPDASAAPAVSAGSPGTPAAAAASPGGTRPCPCPWVSTSSRLPWPR